MRHKVFAALIVALACLAGIGIGADVAEVDGIFWGVTSGISYAVGVAVIGLWLGGVIRVEWKS